MERLRSHRLAVDSPLETVESLPDASSLPALLEAVRSPGVTRADVDALLRGLALPVAEGESPRQRADLLLSLIESQDVGEMQGSDGRLVRAAAVQALLDLGYPYALEVPPDALDVGRSESREKKPQKIPIAGLIATAAGLSVQGFLGLPFALGLLLSERAGRGVPGLLLLGVLLGPAASATFGGWLRMRWLQRLGLLGMKLTGGLWLLNLATLFSSHRVTPDVTAILASLIPGLGFLAGAVLMRRPEWLADQPSPQRMDSSSPGSTSATRPGGREG